MMPVADFPEIRAFIVEWFQRFDRLDPIDVFLPDLHPEVVWDMPDVDRTLSGHARERDWYETVQAALQRPTEHHVSKIKIASDTAEFEVLFRARNVSGSALEVRVQESWRFERRPDGRPLITYYSAKVLQEADT